MDDTYHFISEWDMIIAHPPCTYLTNSSAVRMRVDGKIQIDRFIKALKGKDFFMKFFNFSCKYVCIENPVPLKIVNLPPYTQIIQPYMFGDPWKKRTCLWLKGLPKLEPTDIVTDSVQLWVNGGNKDKNGNYRRFTGRRERDPINRSKTFPGIAKAMADQWGSLV